MKAEMWRNWCKEGSRYRYAAAVFLFGVLLMLLPQCGDHSAATETEAEAKADAVSARVFVPEAETRLQDALRHIEGIGEVEVLLSLKNCTGSVLTKAGDYGSAAERDVICPDYLGAVIICSGADRGDVALAVTRAVQAYTGLGSDKITVIKGGAD